MLKKIYVILSCIFLFSCTTNINQDISNNEIEYTVEGKKLSISVGICQSDKNLLDENKNMIPEWKGNDLIYSQYKKQNCTVSIYDPIYSQSGTMLFVDYTEISDYTRCDCYRKFTTIFRNMEYNDYFIDIREPKMVATELQGVILYDPIKNKDFIEYANGEERMGIAGENRELEDTLKSYLSTGKRVKVKGIIYRGVPDINNFQIEISSLEEVE